MRLFLANRGTVGRTVTLPAGVAAGAVRHAIDCPPEAALAKNTTLIGSTPLTSGTVTLPPYSVALIAPPDAFAPAAGSEPVVANLFPPRPHLTLWHEPYAATQPRFDPAGVYEIDLAPLREKPVVVVTMDLSHLNLTAGDAYALAFSARAEPDADVIVKTPGDGGGGFVPLTGEFAPRRAAFRFDSAANGGNVTFVLPKETLAKAGRVAFRDFLLEPTR